jgi:hypothetical protein
VLVEDAAVHERDVQSAGRAEERGLALDRLPQTLGALAREERLDAVGCGEGQLEAAARRTPPLPSSISGRKGTFKRTPRPKLAMFSRSTSGNDES